jgi:hypothetical protein
MNARRALVLAWGASAVISLGSSLVISRAPWPAESRSYTNWLLYEAPFSHLPLASVALPLGTVLLGAAAVSFWLGLRHGRKVLLLGLILVAYSSYTTVPKISSAWESVADALFYFVSGCLCVTSERREAAHEG